MMELLKWPRKCGDRPGPTHVGCRQVCGVKINLCYSCLQRQYARHVKDGKVEWVWPWCYEEGVFGEGRG